MYDALFMDTTLAKNCWLSPHIVPNMLKSLEELRHNWLAVLNNSPNHQAE
jgi:hypothetical protein